MQNPRRYAPMGGRLAPVRVVAFTWNGWKASAVYAIALDDQQLQALVVGLPWQYAGVDHVIKHL
jgi:hypothetical protein